MKGLVFDSAAVRANAEGVLLISFTANADSTVTKPSIIQPFGFGVDEQALELVTQLRFSPARVNGIPIRSTHMIEIPIRAYFKH
jgi:TonB family protein